MPLPPDNNLVERGVILFPSTATEYGSEAEVIQDIQQFIQRALPAIAVSPEEFQAWVQKVRQSPEKLDPDRYEELARQSVGHPVIYFSAVKPDLFEDIMRKYHPAPGTN